MFFKNATDFTINGGTFTAITTTPTQIGIEKLVAEANPNAMHNSSTRFDPPKCHPGTRLAVLERIMTWIFGSNDRDALILWLYGPAGSGKSAILQTIAEKCAALDILLASFFFSRSDETRNHPDSLVATIACQISTRIPQITSALNDAIIRDPMIFDKTLDAQINVLIVGPLKQLVQSGFFADRRSSPRLILIDGLDECNDADRRHGVLHTVALALREHNLPFIFLISSRPETDIKFSLDSTELVGLWNSLVLDDSYEPDDDILLFLNNSFQSIKAKHPLKEYIPTTWPSSSAVNTLVTKSSGQFIYASTVIKYISVLNASPRQQLDIILGVCPAHSDDIPFAQIDALYMHILSSVRDTQLMLDVLALLMGRFSFKRSNEPPAISQFLAVDEEDIGIILASLSSIIFRSDFGTFNGECTLRISHESLSDFLTDRKRSGRFHIDGSQYSARLAQKGIKWLCSHRAVSVNSSPPPEKLSLDLLDILRAVFTSHRPLQISEDLYQDLKSLPLTFIWCESSRTKRNERSYTYEPSWLYMFEWLLQERKLLPADNSTQVDSRYQELGIRYAMRLKPLFKKHFDRNIIRCFPALLETLAHNLVPNGIHYEETLTAVLQRWATTKYLRMWLQSPKDCLPCTIFKTIGLSATNAGQNPYIHTASQILRSLTTDRSPFSPHIAAVHDYINVHRSLKWLTPDHHQQLSEFLRQRKKSHINSGIIYRIQRQVRLSKFQTRIRNVGPDYKWRRSHHWNSDLVSKLLIPILDQCPKSDKLHALIKKRIRYVVLKYTPRRSLMDAVYRYIRRTSDVESH